MQKGENQYNPIEDMDVLDAVFQASKDKDGAYSASEWGEFLLGPFQYLWPMMRADVVTVAEGEGTVRESDRLFPYLRILDVFVELGKRVIREEPRPPAHMKISIRSAERLSDEIFAKAMKIQSRHLYSREVG